jgi:hypothetical protein
MASESSEMFRELRKQSQKKRAHNREASAKLLEVKGIPFDRKNHGAHLIVTASNGHIIDFWPGTGRWISRKRGKRGFGVRNLIAFIEKSAL